MSTNIYILSINSLKTKVRNKFIPGVPGWLSLLSVSLSFGLGNDLRVREFEPHIRLHDDDMKPAWDSVSLSLCPSPAYCLILSKLINSHKKKKELVSSNVEGSQVLFSASNHPPKEPPLV